MDQILKFEQLILNGIKGLPQDSLKAIAEYVFFIRKKILQPDFFDYEMLNEELDLMDEEEFKHLEKEFENSALASSTKVSKILRAAR